MPLKRLCFDLPAVSDEGNLPYKVPHEHPKHENKQPVHGECGSQVLAFMGDTLSKLYDLKWVRSCYHGGLRKRKHDHAGVFVDLAGVQLTDCDKVGRENPRIFSYAELYIGSNGFIKDEILGSGGFGRVYRAVLPSDDTVVAVKCLAERGEKFEKTFAAELVAVAHLRHRNLVRLRGWCVYEDQLFLVYDYMPNRSLDRVLFRRPDNMKAALPLTVETRRKIVSGLAAALFYLHEQLETQIIHRDVKTSNVMLDSHYNAKLGDFGLARWLEHELEYQISTPSMKNHDFRLANSTRIGGTIGYLPPESFRTKSVATAKSDVFSFGIVVLEVVSGRRAVDLTFPDDRIVLLDWIRRLSDEEKLSQAVDKRLESYNLYEMENLIHIGLLCTLHSPQSRPNMKWVVEALSGNIFGKLPAIPSFQSYPLYISLSFPISTSSSNGTATTNSTTTSTTTSNTTPTNSISTSNYLTATDESIYATAEIQHNYSTPSSSRSYRNTSQFTVETPREISFKEIICATNNFSDSHRVSEVDFGTAYRGFLNNSHHILVKRLGMTTCPALRTRFANELQNLAKLRHRNLVQLRGWCTEQGEMLVVYDYSANRLMSHLLFHHDDKVYNSTLPWNHRYNIIKSLASAIHYLHEEWEEQVIHRNITSSAVFLDVDLNPRLGSFALAEFLTRNDHGHHHEEKKKSVRGIFGYMSPEYMESGEATTMADIYSFGVVVLEVVTGQMAVNFTKSEVLLVKKVTEFEAKHKPLEELVDIRLDKKYNVREARRLVKLGILCTRSSPGLRPSVKQILRILDGEDRLLVEEEMGKESREVWRERNMSSLALIKSIQALGIQ
ncbi:hypothetical protein ACFE04_011913 [Oxalis oulophora]